MTTAEKIDIQLPSLLTVNGREYIAKDEVSHMLEAHKRSFSFTAQEVRLIDTALRIGMEDGSLEGDDTAATEKIVRSIRSKLWDE